ERSPERQGPGAEGAGRQRTDIKSADLAHIAPPAAGASFGRGNVRCANGQSCVPPSSGLFGQNHPTIVTNTGTAPYTTPQGVKMDHTKRMDTAIPARNGQIDGSGNNCRWSGSASSTCVTSTSRASVRSPTTTGWS